MYVLNLRIASCSPKGSPFPFLAVLINFFPLDTAFSCKIVSFVGGPTAKSVKANVLATTPVAVRNYSMEMELDLTMMGMMIQRDPGCFERTQAESDKMAAAAGL